VMIIIVIIIITVLFVGPLSTWITLLYNGQEMTDNFKFAHPW
jgi:hypothetical protein